MPSEGVIRDPLAERIVRRRQIARRVGLAAASLVITMPLVAWVAGIDSDLSLIRRYDRARGVIERAVDPTTFDLTVDGRRVPVRLFGVAPPDHTVDAALTDYLRHAVFGREVVLRLQHDRPRVDGMLAATLWLDESTSLNGELVRLGFAFVERRYPHPTESLLSPLEADARKKRRGLWAEEPPPMPEWRRRWLERLRDSERPVDPPERE